MSITRFTFCILLAMLLCGLGCSSSKPTPEPLAGFHAAYRKVGQSIVNDYQITSKIFHLKKNKGLGHILLSFLKTTLASTPST
jgi:hypothetical protein